jgi:hypothetical protein
MKVYKTFDEFVVTELTKKNQFGFSEWTVVWVDESSATKNTHLHSNDSFEAVSNCIVMLADPVNKKTKSVQLSDANYTKEQITIKCHKIFLEDTVNRVKGMIPEKINGFYEYEVWQDFKDDWLIRGEKVLIPYIYPLVFDLPSSNEYSVWKNNNLIEITYQRLVVTVYLYKKNVFHDIFIKNVSKADIEHYLLYCKARFTLDNSWK